MDGTTRAVTGAEKHKGQTRENPVWPLGLEAGNYLLLVVEADVDIGASLCAQALKLNAAAASVMMAMILMYLIFPSFL
jgi:hypothetical protein